MLAVKPKAPPIHSRKMTATKTKLGTVVIALLLGCGPGMALADPLPDPPPLVLPDPTPGETHTFPPSESTAGTADPGRKLGNVATRRNDPECTALSPCAIPPPSLEHAHTVPSRAPASADPG